VPPSKPVYTPDQVISSFPPNAPKGPLAHASGTGSWLSGSGFSKTSLPNTPTPIIPQRSEYSQQLPDQVISSFPMSTPKGPRGHALRTGPRFPKVRSGHQKLLPNTTSPMISQRHEHNQEARVGTLPTQLQDNAPRNAPRGPRDKTIQQRRRHDAFKERIDAAPSGGWIQSQISRDASEESASTASSSGSILSRISRDASRGPISMTSSSGSIQRPFSRDAFKEPRYTASAGGSIQSRISRDASKEPPSTASSGSSIQSRIQKDDAPHPQQSHGQQPRNGNRNHGGRRRRRKGRKN
jgi:hypothetical protein